MKRSSSIQRDKKFMNINFYYLTVSSKKLIQVNVVTCDGLTTQWFSKIPQTSFQRTMELKASISDGANAIINFFSYASLYALLDSAEKFHLSCFLSTSLAAYMKFQFIDCSQQSFDLKLPKRILLHFEKFLMLMEIFKYLQNVVKPPNKTKSH
ncbi:CLUMA_CG012375, isoform A [Clunio marinus]|uniref:CLUMA_CG012375, isoform A n=1 Tax=Clunio marinus TaxID=568069 RepID=A0A1J1IH91_9DIPT|nr:CLUMA_CG012375, isoform A [Clunio marinus]